jgi:predicted nucleic acid-binding protein
MIKTFTRIDLIRFLYKETTKEEDKKIRKALLVDEDLKEEFKNLKKLIRDIENIELEPSDEVLKKILNYSKSLNLHSVKS